MPLEHERVSVHLEFTSDVDYREAIHKRIAETNRNPTLFKSQQLVVPVGTTSLLRAAEFFVVYSAYIENLDTAVSVDVTYHDTVGSVTVRIGPGDRLLTETVQASTAITATAVSAGTADVYCYFSGEHFVPTS